MFSDRGELKEREKKRSKGGIESKEETNEEVETQHRRYRMKLGSQNFQYF